MQELPETTGKSTITNKYVVVQNNGKNAQLRDNQYGKVKHAITIEDHKISPRWAKAICNTVPGRHGLGWGEEDPNDRIVTCKKCRAKLLTREK